MRRYQSATAGSTRRLAATFLRTLRRQARRRPVILALTGELGSGKTAFVQGLARSLGVRAKVQSPTFVIAKWYRLPRAPSRGLASRQSPFRHFVHIDAYRIERLGEARHLNFPAIFRDRGAIIAIEWADRIKRFIPRNAIWLRFSHGAHPHERFIYTKSSRF